MVGDGDQSIYRFRGADLRNIVQFEDAFPEGVTTIVLDQNYRSTQTILDAANAVIANNLDRKPKHLWTDVGRGDRIVRYWAEDEVDEARFVAATAHQLRDTDAVNWREIAVLYRTNAQSRIIEESLMRSGVPYKVVGGTRYYDRREIRDAMAYLRAVVNPADEVSVKRDPQRAQAGHRRHERRQARPLRGDDRPRVRRCAAPCRRRRRHRSGATRHRLVRRPSSTRSPTASPTTTVGPADLLQAALEGSGYRAELEAEDTVEAHGRLENLDELIGSAHEFTRVDEFLEQVSLVADTDELPDGQVEDQVVLLTLHSAKGLEFPVVFLVGAEEGVFPSSRALSEPDDMEEERRLAYVGITRAREPAVHLPRLEPQPLRQRPPTTRRRGSSRRSPTSSSTPRATCPAARRTAARACVDGTSPVISAPRRPTARRRRHDDLASRGSQRRAPRPGRRGGDRRRSARPPAEPSDAASLGLRIGDDVEHPAWGDGVVIDLKSTRQQRRGDDQLPRASGSSTSTWRGRR